MMLDAAGAQQQSGPQKLQQSTYLPSRTNNQDFLMALQGDNKAVAVKVQPNASATETPFLKYETAGDENAKSDDTGRENTALDLRTGVATKREFPQGDDEPYCSKNKLMKKRPTDQELALNLFIKQLAVELLDRRLTIIQQPRHRLAQLEAACQRQFPDFNERQIRLKVRGQLKLYRRNLKKAEERLAGCLKSTTSSSSASSSPTVFSTQQPSGQTSSTCLIAPSSNTNGTTLANDSVGRPGPFYTVAAEGIHTLLPSSETCSTCNPSVVRLAQTALLNEQRRKGQVCHEILSQTPVSSGGVGGCGTPRSLPAGGPVLLTASSTLANQTPRTQKVLPELRPNLQALQPNTKTLPMNDTIKVSSNYGPVISAPFEQPQKTQNILSSAVNLSIHGGTSINGKTQHQSVPIKPCDAVLASNGLNQTLPAMPVFNEPTTDTSQLNETWPLPDAPNTLIASCLRLTANFLIQSAAFFENKALMQSPLAFAELPPCLPLVTTPILSMPFYPSFSDAPNLSSTPLKANQSDPVLAPPVPTPPTVTSIQVPQQMMPGAQVQLVATAVTQPHATPTVVSVASSTPPQPNSCGSA